MKSQNQFYKNLSHEEIKLIYVKRRELEFKRDKKWTDEQWNSYCANPRNYAAFWYKDLTPEYKKQLEESILQKRRNKWAMMTPQERLDEKVRHRNRRLNYTQEQLDQERARGRANVKKLKLQVLNHYTHGKLCCMNPDCEVPGGAKNILALSVDHINGGGKKHVEEINRSGSSFYAWLKKNKYPPGFQVICMNCNTIKKVQAREDYRTRQPRRNLAEERKDLNRNV